MLPKSFTSELISDLMQAALVKRLAEISFMGAMEFFTVEKSMKSGSRLDHSIGVAFLTERICNELEANNRSTMLAVAAAMLHDVGHTVFSHSAEKYLQENFMVDHIDVGLIFIKYDYEINRSLDNHNIDVNQVLAILKNDESADLDSELIGLFNQPISPDTLEGMYRARKFFEPNCQKYFPCPTPYFSAVNSTEFLKEADDFWNTKNHIYQDYITDRKFSKYDTYFTAYLVENKVDLEDLFLVDKCFEARFKEFLQAELLDYPEHANFGKASQARKYFVNDVEVKEIRDLRLRYSVKLEGGTNKKWRQNLSSQQKNLREKSLNRLRKLVKENCQMA